MGVSAPADAHLGEVGRDLGQGHAPRELAKGVGLRSLFFADPRPLSVPLGIKKPKTTRNDNPAR
jgi:hypothetical protein